MMDVQPKFGGVVKIRFYFGYKIDILRDNELKFGCIVQCSPYNYIMMKLFKKIKIDPFLSKIKTHFYS